MCCCLRASPTYLIRPFYFSPPIDRKMSTYDTSYRKRKPQTHCFRFCELFLKSSEITKIWKNSLSRVFFNPFSTKISHDFFNPRATTFCVYNEKQIIRVKKRLKTPKSVFFFYTHFLYPLFRPHEVCTRKKECVSVYWVLL